MINMTQYRGRYQHTFSDILRGVLVLTVGCGTGVLSSSYKIRMALNPKSKKEAILIYQY
jgi:2-polyprenyl-3-methyl-5-hydroxy-6-metoxy-1,4-benzoquinol methylase